MASRKVGGCGGTRWTRVLVLAVLVVAGTLWVPFVVPPVAAGPVDPHVLRFEAAPSYINLGRNTSVTVEIGSSYVTGDNYRVTVVAPNGTSELLWYNFTGLGPKTEILGDAAVGFMSVIDQVGTYELRLEYFDGLVFTLAGVSELRTTDRLDITFVLRSGSDPYTGVHSCPVSGELVRGAKFIGGAYVRFASTQEFVNATNSPGSVGNIKGAVFGDEHVLGSPPLWHSAWKLSWNTPTGQAKFYVNASDGRGNFGSAVTGTGPHPRLTVIPDVLEVSARITNATSGADQVVFAPGETLRVEVDARYDDKEAHETTADPNPADPYNGPLTTVRGGQVRAHLGWGPYDANLGTFENEFVNLTLSYDSASTHWRATYTVPTNTQNLTAVQAVIFASDGATPSNAGAAFSTQFSIRSPPTPETIEVPIDVPRSTGFELPLVAGLSIVLLIVGLGVGMVLARRRKGAKPEAAPSEEKSETVDEWEEKP